MGVNKLNYTTTIFPQNEKKIVEGKSDFTIDTGIENNVINIYEDVYGQVFEGFGGAFTDSAGYIYSLMSDNDKDRLIKTYFDKNEMSYVLGRMHIDSCDFSLEQYEAMSDPTDRDMNSFTLERTKKYIIPLLNDVENKINRKIEIMITPWSPPAFMKSNKERSHGGVLLDKYKEFWADYICKYIEELSSIGVNVVRMSLQNEPAAIQTWDSCVYSAGDEKEFLKDYIYPALVKHGLEDIEIFLWDHNKERLYERACEIIDEHTDKMISGFAFHWYSGDHFEALDLVKQKFPGKKLILSEACIEYSKFDANDYLANACKYAHDIIGNLNGGMNAFYDWNLVLDETGGPNHVDNLCDAPFLFDTKAKQLLERNTLSYIWHFSHYIKPGAVRIGYSKYSKDLDVTAFKNTDGEIVVVLLNETKEDKEVVIRMQGKCSKLTILKEGITTVQIN